MDAATAEEVARAVATGAPLPAHVDPRIRSGLDSCRVRDLPAALLGLSAVTGRLQRATGVLRGATIYPFATLACVAVAGIAVHFATQSLATTEIHTPLPSWGLPAVFGSGLGCALLLLGLLLGRVRVAGLRRGWDIAERAAWFGAARTLVDSGAEGAAALRGAAAFLPPPARPDAEAAAHALQAGVDGAASVLLPPETASLFFSAARRGALAETLAVLDDHHQVLLRRAIPLEAARVQTAALCFVGGALLAAASAFYWSYSHALLG